MQHRGGQRGVALATALMLMVLLLVLGLSLLSSSQSDLNFQRRQALADRASALARSGVEYYLYLRSQSPSAAPGAYAGPMTMTVGAGEEIILETHPVPLATFTSTGRISRGGQVLYERTIVVPGGIIANSYDQELQ